MDKTYTEPFRFRQFDIYHDRCTMKVGTDGVLLGAWAPVEGVQRALDIGTGSGVIAIMLAQRMADGTVAGIDIEESAAQQAAENMRRSKWSERLQAEHVSLQKYAAARPEPFDLVVSNPPFFTGGTLSENQDRHAVRHAVKLSHGDLLHGVQKVLKPSGRFALILPLIEGMRFREMAESYGFYTCRLTEVCARPHKPVERLLLCFSRRPVSQVVESRLVIQESKGERWTEAYRQLTGAFYLRD